MAGGPLIVNQDRSKIFVWDNRFSKATYTNSTGAPVTLQKGRLLGRVLSSQKVAPHAAGASDGSQQPVGVLGDDYGPIANGASIVVTYCDAGDVAEEQVILNGSETMSTAIGTDCSIRDAINRNTRIKLVQRTEMTGYDNQ